MGYKVRALGGKLTAAAVKNARGRQYLGDGNGLYLQLSPSQTKSWVYRFRANGKLREMGLGSYPIVSLAEARVAALNCTQARLRGLDPIDDRKRQRAIARLEAARSITFKDCTERFLSKNKEKWRNAKHAKQWVATLTRYAYPVFGSLPVQQITREHIMRVLEPMWGEKTETANRLRGRLEAVLDYAIAFDFREGPNPARWKGHLEIALPSSLRKQRVKHHRSLAHNEIADFVHALRQQKGIGALALEFLILTAGRTNEVLGARWDEIDTENREWRIPGTRMKAGKPHRVPLCQQALAILEKMKELGQGDLVFPGMKKDKPLSNMTMLKTLKSMGRRDVVPHGFRSSFRNWAGENGYPRDHAERALAHAVGNEVEAAYYTSDLSEKRRPMMEQWGRYCLLPPGGDAANVVPFQVSPRRSKGA